MSRTIRRRPSPSMIVAGAALVVALAGTAIATPLAVKSVLNKEEKKQVKKIAKNQVSQLAPGLAVASANAANTANTANDANKLDGLDSSAFTQEESDPGVAFARVNGAGTLIGGKGAVSASFDGGTLIYAVTFSRALSDCSLVATPTGAATDQTLATAVDGSNAAVARVGADAATDFHLQVICP